MTKRAREFTCPTCGATIFIRKMIDSDGITLWQFPKVYEDDMGYLRLTKEQVKKYFRKLKKSKAIKK